MHIALLAQLVARGSDKAKVIGSSPVESIEIFLGARTPFYSMLLHLVRVPVDNYANEDAHAFFWGLEPHFTPCCSIL